MAQTVVVGMTTDTSTGLWAPSPAHSTIVLAVLARSEPDARHITDVLERDGVMLSVAFAGMTELALDMLSQRPDVVIVDARDELVDGEAVVRRSRSALRSAGIVVICQEAAGRHPGRYLEAGAEAVVLASELEIALAPAVLCAHAGQISVPRTMRHHVAPPTLSYREKEVLELTARGLTNRQIAHRLCLAESTVKTHLSSAFRRLGVSSRREAAALLCAADDDLRRQLLPVSLRNGKAPAVVPERAV